MVSILKQHRERVIITLLSGILTLLPFFIVTYPPITDIPQQLAQVSLYFQSLGDPDSLYKTQLINPYSLSYLLLGIFYQIVPAESAGKFALVFIGLLWVLSLQLFAFKRSRSPYLALLAGVFFFNHSLYWGLFSFLLGFPIFLFWITFIEKIGIKLTWKEALPLLLLSLFLLFSHLVWLGMSLLVFGLDYLHKVFTKRIKTVGQVLAWPLPIIPATLGAAYWYYHLVSTYNLTQSQGLPFWKRISGDWFYKATLGGLHGNSEAIIIVAALLFALLSLWQNRAVRRFGLDFKMLALAGVFLGATLLMPEKSTLSVNTVSRLAPFVAIFLILALPALQHKFARIAVAAVAVIFLLNTSAVWFKAERKELSGLEQALEKVPENPRLLGLNFKPFSRYFRLRPYMHIYAYPQITRGGELAYSFADIPWCLTVYKEKRKFAWTETLDWNPYLIHAEDFAYFDYAVINGKDSHHAYLYKKSYLKPLTHTGSWRLYQIVGKPVPTKCFGHKSSHEGKQGIALDAAGQLCI